MPDFYVIESGRKKLHFLREIMTEIIKQHINKFTVLTILSIIFGISSNAFGQDGSSPKIEPNDLYIYKGKDSDKPFNFMFNFQGEGVVLYSFEYKGASTIKGNWTFENDVLTVILPKVNSTITLKFKQKGDDLEIIDTQHLNPLISVGTLFKKNVNNPSGKDLTAQEFAELILKFTKNIKSVEDLSAENIEREMGENVWFNEEDQSNYGFWGKIKNSSWRYGLVAYPYPSKDNKTTDTVRFSIDNPNEDADMSSACVAIESFRKDLKSAGFLYFTAIGVHNIARGLVFSRDDLFVQVYVRGSGRDYESFKNNCVDMVLIGAENIGKN